MAELNLVSLSENQECPFCKTLVKAGAAVCSGCGAEHCVESKDFKTFFLLIIFGSIAWSFSGIIATIIAVVLFLAAVGVIAIPKQPSWYR